MRCYEEGIRHLEKALTVCEEENREALSEMMNVARTQTLQAQSLVNYVQFIQMRDAYLGTGEKVLLEALTHLCESELRNAAGALAVCRRDSRIGFSCEGAGTVRGGLFTPAGIEQKITDLRGTLGDLYSALDI
jgi:hypothetical protein